MSKRAYTDAERAEYEGLALSVGPLEASKRTGVPKRTGYNWLKQIRSGDGVAARIIPADTREQVAGKLWQAVVEGTEQVLAGLRDPKARLGDKANALRIVAEQYALLTGGVTERTENLNVNADWMQGSQAYVEADLELRDKARDWTASIATEVLAGYQALKAAGVEEPKIAVDGLQVRAELSNYDMTRVRDLLLKITTAQDAGVSPSDILEALTAKAREGGGNVG
jgi:hypothetical protein